MGLFEHFPYTNFHELNAEWLLKKMKELAETVEQFIAEESVKFADPIIWNISRQYQKSTIVLDPSGNAYLSKQPVPAGIQLNNTEYWLEVFNFADYVRTANQNLTAHVEADTTRATAAYNVDDWLLWDDILYKVTTAIAADDLLIVNPDPGYNLEHFTVEDFIKAWIVYANGLIQTYKNDIDYSELQYRNQLAQDIADTTESLQAQLDLAISGATVDSEVINARLGADGIAYDTLGDAIRSQVGALDNSTDALTEDVFDSAILTPLTDVTGYLYRLSLSNVFHTENSDDTMQLYAVEEGDTVFVTTDFVVLSSDYAAVVFVDDSGSIISSHFPGGASITHNHLDKYAFVVPSGAVSMFVHGRNYTPVVTKINTDTYFDGDVPQDWSEIDKLYDASTNAFTTVTGGIVKRYGVTPGDVLFISTTYSATKDFPGVTFIDSSNNIVKKCIIPQNLAINAQNIKITVPATSVYMYVNCRNTDTIAVVNGLDAITKLKSETDILNDCVIISDADPDQVYASKILDCDPTDVTYSMLTTSDGLVYRYDLPANVSDVIINTAAQTGMSGYPLVIFTDTNDDLIREGYYANNPGSLTVLSNFEITVPSGAEHLYVSSRNNAISVKYKFDLLSTSVSELVPKFDLLSTAVSDLVSKTDQLKKNEFNILFVGNSLTQDAIAYLPYMLKHFYPEINFKIYMWYIGGATLAQQYQAFINNTLCDIFSKAENTASWVNTQTTMASILAAYNFDIVCMQDYFNYQAGYTTDSDLDAWHDCQDYITSNYQGGNGLEFINLLHAPKRDDATNIYDKTAASSAYTLKHTIAEDVIPVGTAIYNALSTTLNNLGDAGGLSNDGTHAQEGLPCLLETYTVLCWLFDKLSINKSVYGLPFKMTTAIYNTINVPGPNLGLGVIEGTDSENALAQEVAINAFKEGKKFVIENLH